MHRRPHRQRQRQRLGGKGPLQLQGGGHRLRRAVKTLKLLSPSP
jgi:hypothetical protein